MGQFIIQTPQISLARQLWRLGEADLASRALELSAEETVDIGIRAGELSSSGEDRKMWPNGPSGVDSAVALAAIEYLEGSARPCARSRRLPEKSLPPELQVSEADRWAAHKPLNEVKYARRRNEASGKPLSQRASGLPDASSRSAYGQLGTADLGVRSTPQDVGNQASESTGHTLEMHTSFMDRIWFVQAPFVQVAAETTKWLNELGDTSFTALREPLPSMLHRLEPRMIPSWKQVVVSTSADNWTAILSQGSDIGTANVVGARLECLHFRTAHHAHITRDQKIVQYGGTSLWMHLGARHIRSIQASYQSRWQFDIFGDPQPFENLNNYTARKIRDRFTLEILNDYCHALGIERGNLDFYGPDGLLIEDNTNRSRDPKYSQPSNHGTT